MSPAWLGNIFSLNFSITGVFKENKCFIGKLRKRQFPMKVPGYLVFHSLPNKRHAVFSDFVIAHELSHITENYDSFRSQIWSEARADFLAYYISGRTDFSIRDFEDMSFHESHEVTPLELPYRRDLNHPAVKSINELSPNINHYHHNSTLISSTLYKLSESLGKEKVKDFILWMDQRRDDFILPFLEAHNDTSDKESMGKSWVHYVDVNDIEDSKHLIREQIITTFELIRGWSKKHLSPEEHERVENLLRSQLLGE